MANYWWRVLKRAARDWWALAVGHPLADLAYAAVAAILLLAVHVQREDLAVALAEINLWLDAASVAVILFVPTFGWKLLRAPYELDREAEAKIKRRDEELAERSSTEPILHFEASSKEHDTVHGPQLYHRIVVENRSRYAAATSCQLAVMQIEPDVRNFDPGSPVAVTHKPTDNRFECEIQPGRTQKFDLCVVPTGQANAIMTLLGLPNEPELPGLDAQHTLMLRFTLREAPATDLKCVFQMDRRGGRITRLERLASGTATPRPQGA